MKRTLKKAMSTLLAALMILGTALIFGTVGIGMTNVEIPNIAVKAEAAEITSYSQGDIIEFGWYPQSEVTDSGVISALNSAGGEWISYNYYSGTGSAYDGKTTASDYMRYKDVIFGSDKYRGVVFDSYRPYLTCFNHEGSKSYQDDNGYYAGTVYWFKYEPIEWRVLDPATGMVMSKTILDSQAFNNLLFSGDDENRNYTYWGDSSKTYYANNYEKSSIREWLNDDFYNTAFSTAQQNIIQYTTLDNSTSTTDKIYLLSRDDALNANYGFSSDYSENDTDRRAQGSDYAKCQGLWVLTSGNYSGNSRWCLRSAGNTSYYAYLVNQFGDVYDEAASDSTSCGVRPALIFNLTSEIFQSDVKDIGGFSASVMLPTTTEPTTTETTTAPSTTKPVEEPATKPSTTEPTTKPEETTTPVDEGVIKTPSRGIINYGDSIILHVDPSKVPAGGHVEWTANNDNFEIVEISADGTTCIITPVSSGNTEFTATIYDAEENAIASDTQEMESNAGFFQRIIAFFKKLFGLTKTYTEAII